MFDHYKLPKSFKVSLETEGEWNEVKQYNLTQYNIKLYKGNVNPKYMFIEVRRRMESWKAPFIWTSGHICDK